MYICCESAVVSIRWIDFVDGKRGEKKGEK
jgi:hypothetical protein